MSLAVRVIPCLDVDAGRVVKGINFKDLRDAGDPVELARTYDAEGADELTFLDISASHEGRATTLEMVSATAEQVFIPLTVGGGVRSVDDVDRCCAPAPTRSPSTPRRSTGPSWSPRSPTGSATRCWCSPSTPVGPRGRDSGFEVTTHGGRKSAGLDAIAWAVRAAELGAGEILLNAMDADGTTAGFDLELIRAVRREVDDPGHRLRRRGRGRALPARGRGGRGRRARGDRLPLRHAADRRRQAGARRGRLPGALTSVTPPRYSGHEGVFRRSPLHDA